MAKVKEIYVEASFLKSLPNYQNFRPTAGVLMTVEDGEDVKDVYRQAWDIVGDQIMQQLKLFEEDKKAGISKGL